MAKKAQFDVVGLGACGIDLIAEVPTYPVAGIKVVAHGLKVFGGGVTANNVTQAAKLGVNAAWVGALGDDSHADWLLKEFKKDGVKVPKPLKLAGIPTQQFWCWNDRRDNVGILGIVAASKALTPAIVRKEFSEVISNAKHFHTEVAVIPLAAALEGAKIAKKAGVKVILDIDGDPYYLIREEKLGTEKELVEIIRLADVLKMTEKAALAVSQEKELGPAVVEKILKMGPKILAVTRAHKGALIADKKTIEHIAPIKVKVVDSVGAGDAFMGGLSYALLQGHSLKKVCEFANATGAYKCTQMGTRNGGRLKDIEKLLKKHS